MQVDDAFVREVEGHIVPQGGRSYIGDIIAATLAVAAERGLVVPEEAPRMWAVKSERGIVAEVFGSQGYAKCCRMSGETVVRVAVVEIKE